MNQRNNNYHDLLDNMQEKYYDIEIFRDKDEISMNPNTFKGVIIKKYKHLKLINVNGLGIGQLHFLDNDGGYLLIPWGYILTMLPSKESLSNKQFKKES